MKKIAVVSLGCPKNLVDTEHMLGALTGAGYEIIEDESLADVILVNTCCFIQDAKQESIDTILDVAQWKQDGRCKRLVVAGCLAQRYRDEIIKELPEVDAVLGVGAVDEIVAAVEGEGTQVLCDKPYSFPASARVAATPDYTAYLKVADGCDNRCTYCVIPSVRGSFQSRPIEDLTAEARRLAARGVKELVLVAQDLTNYGADLYGEVRLCRLLDELCAIEGIKWIRLLYCYPERITDELIDTIAAQEKICKYIDIPIQHCSNDILRKMGRRGTKEQIVQVVKKLRQRVPGITIRTTLITGFPTETEEQYLELEQFIRDMRFDRLGVFAYSQEEQTPAAEMRGQLDEETKRQRREMLEFVQSEVADALTAQKQGRTVTVLTEGYDSLVKKHYGRSEADALDIDGKVFFHSPNRIKPGTFVQVLVEAHDDYDLFGTIKE